MIIDCDAHFTPELDPRLAQTSAAKRWVEQYQARKQGMFSDADNRVLEMAMLGVDRQLLNPMGRSLGLDYALPPDVAPDVMRIYNDAIMNITDQHAELMANIWLDFGHVDAAMRELDRISQRDWVGVYASDLVSWGHVPHMEPFWQWLTEHRRVFYLHLTDDQDQNLVKNQCAAPQPWLQSITSMILSGVMDRYTNLRVVMAERDIDWISDYLEWMSHTHGIDGRRYFQHNIWFTTEPEMPDFVRHAQGLGFDRLLFATDWPHDRDIGGSNSRHDVDTVRSLDISSDQQQLIFSRNFCSLHGQEPNRS